MSKADHYRSRAEFCDRTATSTGREVAKLWQTIGDQYRFLEKIERRTADQQPLTERRPTER